MIIQQNNIDNEVVSATDAEHNWLNGYLSFDQHKARFTAAYQNKVWDGKVRLYSLLTKKFPAGLLPLVRKGAARASLTVDLLPGPTRAPSLPVNTDWLDPLRDQPAALAAALAAGRGIIEAPTGCLAGDTTIEVNRAGKSFRISLVDLVARFNGGRITWGKKPGKLQGSGMRWDMRIPTTVRCRDTDGYIKLRELSAAVYSGVKTTYTVSTASGRQVRATVDHKFLTPDGWSRLGDLTIGAPVFVESALVHVKSRNTNSQASWYKLVNGLCFHPHAGRRGGAPGKGGWSVPLHRLVVEAQLNGVTLSQWVAECKVPLAGFRIFLPPTKYAVHHMDGNSQNNDAGNLAIVPHKEHWRAHGRESGWQHLTAKTELDTITRIELFGDEPVYDLTMKDEPRNFLANGIVVHNSGKTELIVALTMAVPYTWLVCVPSIDLLDQTITRFVLRTGETPGKIGDGAWTPGMGSLGSRVTVATFQTLYAGITRKSKRVLDLLQNTQAASFDEAHMLPANSFLAIPRRLPNAGWRFGFSGTPLARGDQRTVYLIGQTGPVIYRVRSQLLIDNGVLSKPVIRFVPLVQTVPGFHWAEVYRQGIVDSDVRNDLLVAMAKQAAKPALLFVRDIRHGRNLLARCRKAGIQAEFIWGDNSAAARLSANKRLVRGDIDLLIASTIYDQGVDIPEVRSVVLGGGGKSDIKSLQRLGRGMRVSAGKSEVECWDVRDSGQPWLAAHASQRQAIYLAQGYQTIETPLVPNAGS